MTWQQRHKQVCWTHCLQAAKEDCMLSCIYTNSFCSCPAMLPAGPTSSCQLSQLAVLQVLLCVSPAVSPPKHPTS